jgi:hypothetical protein
LSDTAATVRAVEQTAPVELSQPSSYLPASGARLPARKVVKPGKSVADVRIGGKAMFGGGASLVILKRRRVGWPARVLRGLPAEHGKPISDRSVGTGESCIE